MLSQTRWLTRLFASLIASCVVCGGIGAQDQPPVADNNQDEQININRAVESGTDTFKILRAGDKLETNQYVTKVYPLLHANPFEVLPYIRQMVSLEKGTVATATNPDPETGAMRSWIQVNVPRFMIPSIDAAIAQYDVAGFRSSPGDVRISYRTQHRGAQQIADFIRAADLSGDGKIVADPQTNTLYLIDSPSDFERIISNIQFYDIPIPEIDLEIQLVELTDVDQTSLGLDWDAWKRALGGSLDASWFSSRENPSGPGGSSSAHGREFSGLVSLNAAALASFLNYQVDQGKANIVANTTLTVLNGHTASLDSLTEVPEFNYVFDKDQDQNILREELDSAINPKYEGLRIRITPFISMQCTQIDVDVTLRSPVAVGRAGAPIYSEQDVSTRLIVASDQLYKVGGLRRGVVTTQWKGIPGLRLIPGLRYLFANRTDIVRQTELFLFVRPVWVAPELVAAIAKQGTETLEPYPYTVEGILKKNPNLRITPEDQRVLEEYFGEVVQPAEKPAGRQP